MSSEIKKLDVTAAFINILYKKYWERNLFLIKLLPPTNGEMFIA